MKQYIKPMTNVIELHIQNHLLLGSGVKSGGTPGKEYNTDDVSYVKGESDDAWDWDEWE